MLDSELIPFIGQTISRAMTKYFPSLGDFEVLQSAQPTQEGTPSVPTIFFQKFPDRPRGWPMTKYVVEDGVGKEVSVQLYETSIHISSLAWQDPTKPNDEVVTASDILNKIFMYFSMRARTYEFSAAGLNILRVMELSNQAFENDDHRFEFFPTFVLELTHNRAIEDDANIISRITGDLIEIKA